MHEFYFESAAMILTLITVGKMLEARSKGKTTDALKSLMKLAPKMATIVRDGLEVEVPVDQVRTGEIFLVRPGESIPVDGTVCARKCPVECISGERKTPHVIDQSSCIKCKQCVSSCKFDAIVVD